MRLDLGAVRGIVFDLDGTLIDSYEAIAESLNEAMSRLGRSPLPLERVRKMVGRGLETLMARALGVDEEAGAGLIAEGVAAFRRRYDEICVDKTRMLPGVAPTLTTLRQRGYRMSVATNKPSYFATRLLDALGVGQCFDVVLGPDLVARQKPHPEMVLAALAAMHLTPSEAVYVGDMEIDVETARAAGVRVVVLPTGSSDLASLRAAGADFVLASFPALLDLLPSALITSPHS
ncbi:MAG TPA: HAD-IA family hydrolase [Candidatus Polarisedimenticolia bacterium]|jgi:phosphoglycolate phosphatase